MSQENVETIRQNFEAFGRRDFDAWLESWHSDLDYRAMEGALDDIGVFHGHKAMRLYVDQWLDAFDDFRLEPEELIDGGEKVVAAVQITGRMKGSDAAVGMRVGIVYTLRDGKIVEGGSTRRETKRSKPPGLRSRPMSQENVEVFRRFLDALSRGDTDTMLRLADPEIVSEPLRAGVQGAYRGHEGLREFLADNAESFESFLIDFPDVRDLGDGRVLAIGTLHVRGKGSGIETDVPTAGIATYRQGRLIHWKDFGQRATALEAAGLSE